VRAVLGIDAAWTEGEPSGVALVEGEGDDWRTVSVAPSYEAFLALGRGIPVDWQADGFAGSWPRIAQLVGAARGMTSATLAVIAVDMPIARAPITRRRAADSAISKAFGKRGCSTHSPNANRPGVLGASLAAELFAEGFPLATASAVAADSPRAIEVYPHPAVLELLGRDYRVPYKLSRSSRYWPGASVAERVSRLLEELGEIHSALGAVLGGGSLLPLPAGSEVSALSSLKRYEDALDALVCAWVGMRFLMGSAVPHGDESAAIWVPSPRAASLSARGRSRP
jgi:predicted RNase H-like nuclease